jgi:hypothetical protein
VDEQREAEIRQYQKECGMIIRQRCASKASAARNAYNERLKEFIKVGKKRLKARLCGALPGGKRIGKCQRK